MPKSFVAIRSASKRPVEAAVAEVMRLCDWQGVIPAGAKVLVKPNLCTPWRHLIEVANTSPQVLSAVCSVLAERTRNVTIVEADGIRYAAEEAFEMSGTYEVGKRFGFPVRNLSKDELVPAPLPHLEGWGLPRMLTECDAFITVAKIKTHATTTVTAALKNQWGCIAQHDRMMLHKYLHTLIGELNKLLGPKLGIIDGLVGMEGRGPVNGRPVRLNVVMASRDVVALDATAMRFVGLDPNTAEHVVHAARIGVGTMDEAAVEVDSDIEASYRFEPAEKDWPIKLLNLMSRSRFLTRHVLLNDTIFFPARRFAIICRGVKGLLVRRRPHP